MAPWKAFNTEAAAAGVLRGGSGLQPSTTATTVRGGGEVVLTDGPFVETKEQLAGYYVVDCADLDDAIAWARKVRSEEHTSELQSRQYLVCRLLLEKKQ